MQANTAAEPIDARVRRRLRELRTERGLTLQQIAERASIDISTLSRLEAGKRRLAIDHIPALAGALGVSTDELLASSPPQDPRVRGRPRTYDGMTMWPLTHRGPAGGLHAYKIHVSPKRHTPPDVLLVHEGTAGYTSSTAACGCCWVERTSRSSLARPSSSPRGRRIGPRRATRVFDD